MFCLSRDDVAAIVVEKSCGAESLSGESWCFACRVR